MNFRDRFKYHGSARFKTLQRRSGKPSAHFERPVVCGMYGLLQLSHLILTHCVRMDDSNHYMTPCSRALIWFNRHYTVDRWRLYLAGKCMACCIVYYPRADDVVVYLDNYLLDTLYSAKMLQETITSPWCPLLTVARLVSAKMRFLKSIPPRCLR
jgi:hypothetical protein